MYQFNRDDVFRFKEHVGIKTYERGDELLFQYCPYCRRSDHGNDKKFSINLKTGQFECKRASCGAKGNMITLARDFDFELNDEFEKYYRKRHTYKTLHTPQNPIIPSNPAIEYLKTRGISEETAKAYQITSHTKNENVICFPIFDENKKLVNVKYRNTKFVKGETKGSKEWFETNCTPYLYGIQAWDGTCDRFILTEGMIDCFSVYESGIGNAFSVPGGAKGFTWYPPSYEFVKNFKEIVVFGDYENGHITLLEEMKQRFGGQIRHVKEEDYLDCKDANDILRKYGKEQVRKCIENAVLVPVKDVIDLAEVEDVDISKLEKLPTGIDQLDRLLYGGLPFGGIHIISGKAGTGKSTLASQIIVNAKSNGYTCFAYSGELPNYLFKGWMSFQVAGRKHTYETKNAWQESVFGISENNKHLISEWYRDHVYIFDNSLIDGSDETANLIEIVRRVIQQYGARVILLDNLMTAMTMERVSGSDQYERQTDFMNRLRGLAVRYNVMILLVAHKRKGYGNDENDEIAGSANIANLAMLTMTFSRDTDNDSDNNIRILRVPKNRLFGRIETEGFRLNYDERSRRIYGNDNELNREYDWMPKEKETVTPEGFTQVDLEIPDFS